MAELTTKPRTWEATINVSGPLSVPFEDWPAEMQDAVEVAMEGISEKYKCPVTLLHTEYKTDPDIQPNFPGHHYVHVIIGEVVVADERQVDPERVVKELPKGFLH